MRNNFIFFSCFVSEILIFSNKTQWVDGALAGCNNPSLLVATEGLEFARGERIDTFVSLGCGDVDFSKTSSPNPGLLFWLNQALSLAFDSRVAEDRTGRLLEQASPETNVRPFFICFFLFSFLFMSLPFSFSFTLPSTSACRPRRSRSPCRSTARRRWPP